MQNTASQKQNASPATTGQHYYIITPNNTVRGPFKSVEEAQQNIPDSHDVKLADHVTDMKGCSSNLCRNNDGSKRFSDDAEIEHLESWVRDADDDADEKGYLIFCVEVSE